MIGPAPAPVEGGIVCAVSLGEALVGGQEPRPRKFKTVIVARGGDDFDFEDVVAWIAPLLRGLPAGSGLICSLALGHGGAMSASCFDDRLAHVADIEAVWPAEDCSAFLATVPAGDRLIAIALAEGHSQALALLDVVCEWLCLRDLAPPDMAGLSRLLGALEALLETPLPRAGRPSAEHHAADEKGRDAQPGDARRP